MKFSKIKGILYNVWNERRSYFVNDRRRYSFFFQIEHERE